MGHSLKKRPPGGKIWGNERLENSAPTFFEKLDHNEPKTTIKSILAVKSYGMTGWPALNMTIPIYSSGHLIGTIFFLKKSFLHLSAQDAGHLEDTFIDIFLLDDAKSPKVPQR